MILPPEPGSRQEPSRRSASSSRSSRTLPTPAASDRTGIFRSPARWSRWPMPPRPRPSPRRPAGSSARAWRSSGRAALILPSACSTSARPPTPPVIRPGSSATAPLRSRMVLEPGEDTGGDGVAIVAGESPERHVRPSLDCVDEAPTALADGSHDGPAAVEQRAHGGHEPRRQALHLADLVDEIDVDASVHGERGPRRGLEHARIDAILAYARTAAAVDVSHGRAAAVEGDQLEAPAHAPDAHLLGEEPAERRAREPGRDGVDRGGLANSGRPGDQERHGGRAPSRSLPEPELDAPRVSRGSATARLPASSLTISPMKALGIPEAHHGRRGSSTSPGRRGS